MNILLSYTYSGERYEKTRKTAPDEDSGGLYSSVRRGAVV